MPGVPIMASQAGRVGMPRILLDVDGVLADFITTYLHALAAVTGSYRHPAEVINWEIGKSLGLSEDTQRKVSTLLRKEGVASSMPVYPGAIEGVKKLTLVAEVYFVTSPFTSPTWTYDRDQWLDRHFGAVGKNVVHTAHKHLISGDVLVDDKPVNVRAWAKAWPLGTPVLWSQPYNERERTGTLMRCLTWEQIYNLAKLYKGKS